MNNKLSALKFVRNNKKQSGVMIIALALTFMTMYIMNFLFLTTQESFKALFIEQPKKVAFVDLCIDTMGVDSTNCKTEEELYDNLEARREDIMSQLESQEGISEVIYTQCLYAHYQGIIGEIGYDFPLLEAEQIPSYIEHMDAKLIEGRMPENSGEILVDSKVLNNQHMSLNGYFNESSYGKVFKVVGVLESDNLTCVGTPQGYTNSGWYMVVQCENKNADMNKALKNIGISTTEYDTIWDKANCKEMYKEMVTDQLDAALIGILIVVMIFLAISIIVAYVSFMRNRVNEYCLYTSIGFARSDVYGMMMREIAIIFGGSLILGAIITIIIMLLMGNLVLDNLGLVYRYLYPQHLLRILAAFMAIVGLLQLPIIFTINNIKTIDLIED